MPNFYNLTADLGDLIGGDAIAATARGSLQTNLKSEALIDTGTGGQIRLGDWPVTINADGTLLVEGLVGSDSTDLNIEAGTLQYQLTVQYRDPARKGREADRTYRSGWFFLNAATDVATVAKAVTPAVAATGADIISAASLEADRAEAAAESAALSATIAAQAGPAAVAALGVRAALDAGITTGIAVIGDSTGNDNTEWVELLGQAIAAAHPEFTVQHALWSDVAQDISPPVVIQTGTEGIQYLDTTSHTVNRSLSVADSPHTPGVLDIRVRAKLPSWSAPATTSILASRFQDAPNRSWYFAIPTSGRPVLYVSTDGTNTLTKVSDTTLATAGGTTQWVRVVYTPSANVKFYTSADGATWTQLGSTIGNTDGPVFNAAAPYELGGRGYGTTSNTAHIFAVDIRNGLDGPPLVPRLPDLWGSSQRTSAAVVGAPTLTLVNGSHPGADLNYWTAARMTKALPDFGQMAGFLSLSHNELDWSGPDYAPRYAAKVAEVKATLPPGIPLIYLTQNPQVPPRSAEMIAAQTRRRVDIIMEAVKAGDVSIDTYAEFVRVGTATTVQADGIHPTLAGSQLWADTVEAAIGL